MPLIPGSAPRPRLPALFLLLLAFACLSRTPLTAAELGASTPPQTVEGQIIVRAADGVSALEFADIVGFYDARLREHIDPINTRVLHVPAGIEQAIVQELGQDPGIVFAERDMKLGIESLTPNDPKYADQWHLHSFESERAWRYSQGSGITVAVLDTGVHGAHPDFGNRVLAGWNAVDQGTDSSDINGHGTKVAGVIAAVTDNGIGVASIAPQTRILPIRVSNDSDGGAYLSDIARGLTYAADAGADVANISYNVSSSSSVASAAEYMRDRGGVVVVAAGNDGIDPGYSDSPAMITVSATTSSDSLASWSNFGAYVDVSAPGQGIWTLNRNDGYSTASGTSFASPATAGVVALIMAADPDLSPAEVETLLETHADDLGSTGWDPQYGHGRVNAGRVTEQAAGGDTPDTQPPVVTAPAAVTVEATGALTGVTLGSASAHDDIDGNLNAVPDTTGPFPVGSHSVTWTATDSAGNTGSAIQSVTVQDTTAPEVQAPADLTVQSTGDAVAVDLGSASASDRVDGSLSASADNIGPFALGTHTVTWTATDAAGNSGSDTQTVVVTLSDVTAPVVSAPPDILIEASGSLTAVALGSASAVDNIDGSLSASPNRSGPFPVGSHTVTWTATDSAGNTGSATQTVSVQDTTPPSLNPPATRTLDATGYLTNVNLKAPTATDLVDGDITAVADRIGPFTSGRHNITWTATDAAGNSRQVVQTLKVRPLAEFELDQEAGEGDTVEVRVQLSGDAADYPVRLPYRVGGSATPGQDHDASDGELVIRTGRSATLSFNVVDEQAVGEGDETVTFTLDTPDNAALGGRASHTVTLREQNLPPRAELEVRQDGQPTSTVYASAGQVRVTARVEDANPDDSHTYDWSLTDASLVSTSGVAGEEYSFDPQQLAPGIYILRLTVTDDGSPAEAVTVQTSVQVASRPPALNANEDSDNDGIDDASEGTGDSKGNGIPDYLDALPDRHVLQSRARVADRDLLVTEAGLRLRLGTTALAAGRHAAGVSATDIVNHGSASGTAAVAADDARRYPGGLFDFELTGLSQAGQSVQVVVPQLAPIPAGGVYRKYLSDQGWQEFVIDARNRLASAPGGKGSCPSPSSPAWREGLNAGDLCVRLTLEDGGPNDADGRANGQILDPGGVAAPASSGGSSSSSNNLSSSEGGGGGGCSLGGRSSQDPLFPLLALFAAAGLLRRGCRAQG
ncbi:S8 family peptidase [Thiohalobacter thiocyanaticus]|uniref:HYR domain-containing protein n=1 Tax=Thiohalobacter thiocyanaticus TaxID=585455 RepID=A0A426QH43_9GAMM|nr:S8 family serine peptidase [Thiohalobacter thiocyanaticus]RRQ21050.1 HYR domain-containing protein [Thiohalobacter thiocyanaticus]